MAPTGQRRTDRISLTLLLEASGRDVHGNEFKQPAHTVLINRTGGVILLDREVALGTQIHLRRRSPTEAHREGDARVVGQFAREKEGFLYGVELAENHADLWGIDFPPIAESSEAVARMLLECSNCRSREVVYLNEVELLGFETNRGIARHCKTCGVPSVWTQAPHEDEKKMAARASRTRKAAESANTPPENEQRERKRLRLRTRLTACIRQPNADDELAVCEDISPVGMCFRSKRRYETDTPIEVAVPYTPGAANIFLPARIVYSEEIAKAGLFRHGTEYRKIVSRS
jgi:PilZ domain